jgi:hypothetical protein
MVRLTPSAKRVLKQMASGKFTLVHFLEPEKPFFRSLGAVIPCRMNFLLVSNHSASRYAVRYSTFHKLFKYNLISPTSPDATDYKVQPLGYKRVARWKRK